MRIGELSAATGASVRALRYYEEQRLLSAERAPSGQRHYAAGAVDRVLLIRRLYAAGMASRTIAELLPCIETDEVTEELLGRLAAERDRVDRRIGDLAATRDALDSALAAASDAHRKGTACPRSTEAPPPVPATLRHCR